MDQKYKLFEDNIKINSRQGSLVHDSKTESKEENIKTARYYMIFSTFCFALSTITMKMITMHRTDFSLNLFTSIRFLTLAVVALYYCRASNVYIKPIFQVENKLWFAVRISSNFISLISHMSSLTYIKLGTSACISMTFPILINLLSIYFFNEKPHIKYYISCIVCLLGCYYLTLGEASEDNEITIFTIFGVSLAILSSIATAFINISAKKLYDEFSLYELNLNLGIYISFLGFIFSLFEYKTFISNITDIMFIFYSMLNGFIAFYAIYYGNLASKMCDLSKISYIHYLCLIYVLIMGVVFFGEDFSFYDFLGCTLIVGTNMILTYFK